MPPLSQSHHVWMQHAMDIATQSLPLDVPVGALILDETGTLLAEGFNTREHDADPSGHAEINALRLAGQKRGNWRLSGCTLVVTLEPCPMCATALLHSRISTIVYGTPDPIQGGLGSALDLTRLYPHPPHIIAGIEEARCRAQLDQFFQSLRQPATV